MGLDGAAGRRFAGYSLGMRQRLYMAAQLFPGVRAVLLDEPTNGLDVEGREQVWRMLMDLAKQGVSLFVSTHQVLEAERYAEYLVVLHGGRVAYQGRYRDLATRRRIIVRVDDPGKARAVLARAGFRADRAGRDGGLFVEAPADRMAEVLQALKRAGVHVLDGRLEDLEELYWRIKDDVQRTDEVEA
nr:AAA family ATPase [Oceanithermus sp.]